MVTGKKNGTVIVAGTITSIKMTMKTGRTMASAATRVRTIAAMTAIAGGAAMMKTTTTIKGVRPITATATMAIVMAHRNKIATMIKTGMAIPAITAAAVMAAAVLMVT